MSVHPSGNDSSLLTGKHSMAPSNPVVWSPAMTTPKQIEANRRNALRSTGPRTPAGKAIVSQNAARHGLYSSSPVIPGVESPLAWEQHLASTVTSFAPVGPIETALAERIALILWRIKRITRDERDVTSGSR